MQAHDLKLIPYPESIVLDRSAGAVALAANVRWATGSGATEADRFALGLARRALRRKGEPGKDSMSGPDGGGRTIGTIRLARRLPSRLTGPEAYRLQLEPSRIMIAARTEAGRYYAIQTLVQLIGQFGRRIPALRIEDEPDFKHRGFMHDVSRGKVPRLKTLLELVEQLAALKYNQLQLYIEHTYAFARHPLLGRGHSPLTAADLKALDRHCRRHHVRLVPNLQSFGHASHTLEHARYRGLAESDYRGGWTLSPVEPGTYRFLKELYEEFLPNFSEREYFNVGCDETWDLGRGKSAALAKKIGLGRVYLGHLLEVRRLVRSHGRKMMFWGDILADYPELVAELPRDVVLLNWWYEASTQSNYRRRLAPARRAGLEHWVCPGTSSWNSLFFRRRNARWNLREMARGGIWSGATGYLVTDWGDNGHYNFLSYSLWPLAYGAECAWRAREDRHVDRGFDWRFALQVLDDPRGEWIEPMRLLGDLYLNFGARIANNSPERWLLTGKPEPARDRLGVSAELEQYNLITRGGLQETLEQARRAGALLENLAPKSESLKRVRAEWRLGARLAEHACRRALWHNHGRGDPKRLAREMGGLRREFSALWLERNRRSDLARNLAELRLVEEDYARIERQPIRF